MKSAVIIDFAACRTPQEMPAEPCIPPSCPDELGAAIQLLIQALRQPELRHRNSAHINQCARQQA